ncbi:MAG: RNA polymerase sigma-70 factor, ECF subfamily [Parcubacteria group bacterium Gr01-1014_8]|nr:MAG: RNA polymerase sigma-70 factor, ECF subfamily [Parcubacteria group bacterium Gr01-1014_8]
MHVEQTESDEEIACRVQGGDIDAFGILVDRYEQKLARYGRRFVARDEDIQDIVQDVFVSAYQNIQGFDATLRFSPWIYRIAHNACVNALRKSGRTAFSYDFDALVSHHVYEDPAESERDVKDMRLLLDRGLDKMQAKYREILILHYYEDMQYRDIADILQIPIGTVSIRMKRAKEALRENIKNEL